MPTRIYRNFRYQVIINDVDGFGASAQGSFSEVTGFDATYDVVEYRTGGDVLITPEKFPGLIKYGNVTLSRGVSTDESFFKWIAKGLDGTISVAKNIVINLMDDTGQTPIASWQLINAWAVKYTGPDFKGNASEVAMEKIEIAHRGLSRLAVADAPDAGTNNEVTTG